MRTLQDGIATFEGTSTNYDYYCLKNRITNTNKTKINDIDRETSIVDLNNFKFIPSGKFAIFSKLMKGNDKVNIIYNTNYHIMKPYTDPVKPFGIKFCSLSSLFDSG